MNADKEFFETMLRACQACGDLPTRYQLDALQLAWLTIASNARTEALRSSGGFIAERDRQVAQLRKMADVIALDAHEPDLEMERLFREGDHTGLLEHLNKLLRRHTEDQ